MKYLRTYENQNELWVGDLSFIYKPKLGFNKYNL